MESNPHQWSSKDKIRYLISMVPVLVMLIGTTYYLEPFSIFLALLWWLIYLVVNIFQAGCCIGCPYRGHYCPAFFGVYIGNGISNIFYKDFKFEEKQFKKNALGGVLSLTVFLFYPVYWLFITDWYLVLVYFGLCLLHVVIFMPTQCKHCSYNDTCPGGKSYHSLCRLFRRF